MRGTVTLPCCTGSGNGRPDGDRDTATLDPLPATDLRGFAQFDSAVNAHFAGGHYVLALSAAVGNSGQLQQLAQLYVVTGQLNVDCVS